MVVMKTSSCFSAQYGAKADLYDEVLKGIGDPGKLAAPDHLEKMDIITDLSIAENSTSAQQRWNLVQEYERQFEQLSEDQKISKVWSLSNEDNTTIPLPPETYAVRFFGLEGLVSSQFSRARFVMSTLFLSRRKRSTIVEGQRLYNRTSWKVRVPDRVFRQKWAKTWPRHVYVYVFACGNYIQKTFRFFVCSEFTHTQCDFTFTHVLWHMYTHVLMCRDTQQTDRHTQTPYSAQTPHRHHALPFQCDLESGLNKTNVSRLERWWTLLEKRKVRRELWWSS